MHAQFERGLLKAILVYGSSMAGSRRFYTVGKLKWQEWNCDIRRYKYGPVDDC